ncbi:hypothetical protein [Akkermansia sp.]|uniref:hypothetical protein n=1 Tax=Akkermansia sp. TaxID=1872421 RepID=UPI003AB6F741
MLWLVGKKECFLEKLLKRGTGSMGPSAWRMVGRFHGDSPEQALQWLRLRKIDEFDRNRENTKIPEL